MFHRHGVNLYDLGTVYKLSENKLNPYQKSILLQIMLVRSLKCIWRSQWREIANDHAINGNAAIERYESQTAELILLHLFHPLLRLVYWRDFVPKVVLVYNARIIERN